MLASLEQDVLLLLPICPLTENTDGLKQKDTRLFLVELVRVVNVINDRHVGRFRLEFLLFPQLCFFLSSVSEFFFVVYYIIISLLVFLIVCMIKYNCLKQCK